MKIRYWIIILVSISLLVSLLAFLRTRGSDSEFEMEVARLSSIIQEVSLTGRVRPVQQVDLSFEKTGKVSLVLVNVGDTVRAGEILIGLTDQELSTQYLRNQAVLEAEQSRLQELERGTRIEELQLQEAHITDSRVAINSARESLIDVLKDSFTKSDDAIRNRLDQIFDHPRGLTPQVSFFANDSVLEAEIEIERRIIRDLLTEWQQSLKTIDQADDLNLYIQEAEQNFAQIKQILDKAGVLLSGVSTVINPSMSQSTFDSWRSGVSVARTNINSGLSNLTTARERFEDTVANLAIAEQELVLKEAGVADEQIAAQQARVKQVRADLQGAAIQLTKTKLLSPINGVVTKQEAKVGQLALASNIIVSVISSDDFKIEANVAEADIIKIKVGNKAQITLDAYGPDIVFDAQVIKIDPAETIIDGVVTYKMTLMFEGARQFLKSGMTANIDVVTAERQAVIVIPQRAVIRKDGRQLVRILVNNRMKEVPVKTGLRGRNGRIEIITGLSQGDWVITFIKD